METQESVFALGGSHSGFFLQISDWKKKSGWTKEKTVGKTAGQNSGRDAQRTSRFHTLKSDMLLPAVSRVTSEPDYSHTDKTCCPTNEEHSVTVEEHAARTTLSVFVSFAFRKLKDNKQKRMNLSASVFFFFFSPASLRLPRLEFSARPN